MKHLNWTEADSRNAKRIWAEYQEQHDITERIGQTAGIDPKSGRIWFGDSILKIVEHRRTEDLDSPLFFERVGYAAYLWKRLSLERRATVIQGRVSEIGVPVITFFIVSPLARFPNLAYALLK